MTGAVEVVEEVVAGIDELEVRVQGEGTTPEGKVSRLGLNLSQALVEKGSRCWSNIVLLERLLCGNSRISLFPYLTYQHGAKMNPSSYVVVLEIRRVEEFQQSQFIDFSRPSIYPSITKREMDMTPQPSYTL